MVLIIIGLAVQNLPVDHYVRWKSAWLAAIPVLTLRYSQKINFRQKSSLNTIRRHKLLNLILRDRHESQLPKMQYVATTMIGLLQKYVKDHGKRRILRVKLSSFGDADGGVEGLSH